jgi:hypothetical protein
MIPGEPSSLFLHGLYSASPAPPRNRLVSRTPANFLASSYIRILSRSISHSWREYSTKVGKAKVSVFDEIRDRESKRGRERVPERQIERARERKKERGRDRDETEREFQS